MYKRKYEITNGNTHRKIVRIGSTMYDTIKKSYRSIDSLFFHRTLEYGIHMFFAILKNNKHCYFYIKEC